MAGCSNLKRKKIIFTFCPVPSILLFPLFFFSLGPSYRMGRVYKWKWSGYVCESSLRRWSLFLLVGFTDPYNHTYSESLWWKLFKNHKRTQIQRQTQWQRQWQGQRHIQSARKPNICYIFEILMTYSFQIWWKIPHPSHPVHASHPGYPVPVIRSVLQGRVYHRFGIFCNFFHHHFRKC